MILLQIAYDGSVVITFRSKIFDVSDRRRSVVHIKFDFHVERLRFVVGIRIFENDIHFFDFTAVFNDAFTATRKTENGCRRKESGAYSFK